MLDVYSVLHRCNVTNLLVNFCVWNYTPVKLYGLRITFAEEFLHFNQLSMPPTWRRGFYAHLCDVTSPRGICRNEEGFLSFVKMYVSFTS